MSTEERAMAVLARANPMPDTDSLELEFSGVTYLATLEQRSSEVTQLDTKRPEQKSQKPSPMLWLVAAAAVIVMGIALVLINQDNDEAPVATDPTPTTIAETAPTTIADEAPVDPRADEGLLVATAFAEAQARLDVEEMLANGDGSNSLWGVLSNGATTAPLEAEFREAVGWVETVQDCSISSTNEIGMNVTCSVVTDTAFSRSLGADPMTDDVRYTVRYEGETHVGQTMDKTAVVDRLHSTLGLGRFRTEAWAPFVAWVKATHPEDVEVMFADGTASDSWYLGVGSPALTADSIELWRLYTAEFASSQN